MFKYVLLTVILIASVFVGACGGQSQPSPSPTPSITPPPTAPSGTTAAQLADLGKTVFANRCAGCHGESGQGVQAPAVIGAGTSLGKYNTAEGLFNFVSTAMPAKAPGSLSQQDYLNVVSYLLLQNSFVAPTDLLDASRLGSITLN